MLCLDECKAKLVSFKQCFGHEFGIKSIGIFGSVARQENREDSDLDIVVDIDNPTLSTMYTLKTVLTEMFHCEIDLVRFRSSLPPFLKQNIEKEAIYVERRTTNHLRQVNPDKRIHLLYTAME